MTKRRKRYDAPTGFNHAGMTGCRHWADTPTELVAKYKPALLAALENSSIAHRVMTDATKWMWVCVVNIVLTEYYHNTVITVPELDALNHHQRRVYYAMRSLAWHALRRGVPLMDSLSGDVLPYKVVCSGLAKQPKSEVS